MTAKASAPIDADRIAEAVTAAHAKHQKNRRGKNVGYIPALAEVDPQLFGVCVVTVDGQTFSVGDARCCRFKAISPDRGGQLPEARYLG